MARRAPRRLSPRLRRTLSPLSTRRGRRWNPRRSDPCRRPLSSSISQRRRVTPERRRSSGGARRREVTAALLFLSPWLVGFLVFTAWPLIYSVYLSLTDYDVINNPEFIGTENYVRLFQDPKIALALGNTLFFTAIQVPLYVIVSLALALLLNRAGRSAGTFRTLFYLPKMTPPVAVGIFFLLLFNGQNGLVNQVLGWFGIDGPAWTTDGAWVKPGLIIMSLWTVGASVIILLAALQAVPEELYESARLDGAGFWRQSFSVTVPMISPGPLLRHRHQHHRGASDLR